MASGAREGLGPRVPLLFAVPTPDCGELMSTVPARFPSLAGRAHAVPRAALWVLAAVVLGVGVGLAAALQQTAIAVAILLLPALVVLLLHPDWLPPVLVAAAFGEAIKTGSITVSRFVGPLAVVTMVLALPARKRLRLTRVGVLSAVLAYSAWALASALWTVNPDSSFHQNGGGYALASLALSIVFMLGIIMFVQREYELRRLAIVVWCFSVGVGLVAIVQYLSGYTRSLGLSGDANFFAAVQVVAIPVEAVLVSQVNSTRMRAIVLVGLAVTVGSVMTSLSRGGILTLAVAFLLLSIQPASAFFRTRARKRAFMLVAAVGGAILLIATYSALSARTSSLFTTADGGSGRTNLWLAAVQGWHQHPLLGMGFGAFVGQSDQLLLTTPGVDFSAYALRPTGQFVHNAYLESLTELGPIGLALFLGILVTTAATLLSTARRAARAGAMFLSSFARALLVSLAAFAFASLFLSSETDRALWILLGLAVVLPGVLTEEQRRHQASYAANASHASATVLSSGDGPPDPSSGV
jgi:O-antigen ligase